jgi:hypothetical protein
MRFSSFLPTLCISLVLTLISTNAYAEYYLECYEPIPNIVTINCKHNHCSFKNRHASNWHQDTRRHRNHNIEKYCNQDMATGDDNACLHPDMQIN